MLTFGTGWQSQANIWGSAGSQRHQKGVKMSVHLRQRHSFTWPSQSFPNEKPAVYRMQSADSWLKINLFFIGVRLTFNSSRASVLHRVRRCWKIPPAGHVHIHFSLLENNSNVTQEHDRYPDFSRLSCAPVVCLYTAFRKTHLFSFISVVFFPSH